MVLPPNRDSGSSAAEVFSPGNLNIHSGRFNRVSETTTGLADLKLPELKKAAASLGIAGASTMKKGDLVAAISAAKASASKPAREERRDERSDSQAGDGERQERRNDRDGRDGRNRDRDRDRDRNRNGQQRRWRRPRRSRMG